mmetsp:Transcript_6171/g.15841  ORF Transcript_6171/g.15841 Transcript_6171/m.15841 type:complete len:410 (-) Transcript_6171:477-1706(-)
MIELAPFPLDVCDSHVDLEGLGDGSPSIRTKFIPVEVDRCERLVHLEHLGHCRRATVTELVPLEVNHLEGVVGSQSLCDCLSRFWAEAIPTEVQRSEGPVLVNPLGYGLTALRPQLVPVQVQRQERLVEDEGRCNRLATHGTKVCAFQVEMGQADVDCEPLGQRDPSRNPQIVLAAIEMLQRRVDSKQPPKGVSDGRVEQIVAHVQRGELVVYLERLGDCYNGGRSKRIELETERGDTPVDGKRPRERHDAIGAQIVVPEFQLSHRIVDSHCVNHTFHERIHPSTAATEGDGEELGASKNECHRGSPGELMAARQIDRLQVGAMLGNRLHAVVRQSCKLSDIDAHQLGVAVEDALKPAVPDVAIDNTAYLRPRYHEAQIDAGVRHHSTDSAPASADCRHNGQKSPGVEQ